MGNVNIKKLMCCCFMEYRALNFLLTFNVYVLTATFTLDKRAILVDSITSFKQSFVMIVDLIFKFACFSCSMLIPIGRRKRQN